MPQASKLIRLWITMVSLLLLAACGTDAKRSADPTAFAQQQDVSGPSCPSCSWSLLGLPPSAAPSPRGYQTAVWTGASMLVFGGLDNSGPLGDEAHPTSPAASSWTPWQPPTSPRHAPSTPAVWTGTRMIVDGALGSSGALGDGAAAADDPVADIWTPCPPPTRPRHANSTARCGPAPTYDRPRRLRRLRLARGRRGVRPGGRQLDGRSPRLLRAATTARCGPARGAIALVFGGYGSSGLLVAGAAYNPVADTWTPSPRSTPPRPARARPRCGPARACSSSAASATPGISATAERTTRRPTPGPPCPLPMPRCRVTPIPRYGPEASCSSSAASGTPAPSAMARRTTRRPTPGPPWPASVLPRPATCTPRCGPAPA